LGVSVQYICSYVSLIQSLYSSLDDGELGLNNVADVRVATELNFGAFKNKSIAAVAIGYSNTIVLDTDNKLYGFGKNKDKVLDKTKDETAFVQAIQIATTGVLAGKTITKIVAGISSIASRYFVISEGIAYAWGNGNTGLLGVIFIHMCLLLITNHKRQDGTSTSKYSADEAVKVKDTGVLSGKTVVDIISCAYTCHALDSGTFNLSSVFH
jgi:alpha-tubulin suppressor-like RCC1 family protein